MRAFGRRDFVAGDEIVIGSPQGWGLGGAHPADSIVLFWDISYAVTEIGYQPKGVIFFMIDEFPTLIYNTKKLTSRFL